MTGERCEAVAFNFCKCATVVLLTGKYALPVAAGAAAFFYLQAHLKGYRQTRCVLKYPLLIAAFWSVVAAISVSKMISG